jgi:hypothetical protein
MDRICLWCLCYAEAMQQQLIQNDRMTLALTNVILSGVFVLGISKKYVEFCLSSLLNKYKKQY